MIAFLTLTPDPSPFQGEGSLRFHTPLPRGRGARGEGMQVSRPGVTSQTFASPWLDHGAHRLPLRLGSRPATLAADPSRKQGSMMAPTGLV